MRSPRLPVLFSLLVLTACLLTACTDAEDDPGAIPTAVTREDAFLEACHGLLSNTSEPTEQAAESCQCAIDEAGARMSPDAYDTFLVSFLPDRDEQLAALMEREGFEVEVEAFSMQMLEVMEDCGFGGATPGAGTL